MKKEVENMDNIDASTVADTEDLNDGINNAVFNVEDDVEAYYFGDMFMDNYNNIL